MCMEGSKAAFARLVISRLRRRYRREMHTSLHHGSPLELLVATMLSAQAQDASVNRITPRLFRDFRSVRSYAALKPPQLYPYTRSIGLYRNKSKNIVAAAKKIMADYGSKVPDTMEGLTSLPGVGRKTANVVLYNAFHRSEGIAIDTHCITVANRLGLVRTADTAKIERTLMKIVPRDDWGDLTHLFIALGRDVCTAKRKYCGRCVLNSICPSSTVTK